SPGRVNLCLRRPQVLDPGGPVAVARHEEVSMAPCRIRVALLTLAVLAGPAAAKDKAVRITLGPFRVEAKRDRQVCQAVRIPKGRGMEIAWYEARSLPSQRGTAGTHHMVV